MAELDLTSHEPRLLLGALWAFRTRTTKQLEAGGDDLVHIVETLDTCDSAARKLGGDPQLALYGAMRF